MPNHAPRRSNFLLATGGLSVLVLGGGAAADSTAGPSEASNGRRVKSMPAQSNPNASVLARSIGPLRASSVAAASWLERAYGGLRRGDGDGDGDEHKPDVKVPTLKNWTDPVRISLGGGAWVGSTDRREHQFLVQRQEYRLSQEPLAVRK